RRSRPISVHARAPVFLESPPQTKQNAYISSRLRAHVKPNFASAYPRSIQFSSLGQCTNASMQVNLSRAADWGVTEHLVVRTSLDTGVSTSRPRGLTGQNA